MEPVKPYGELVESKKKQVKKMFDRIAPAYDTLNTILSLGIDKSWRKKAIAQLPTSTDSLCILDVATGTCDMSIQAAKRYPHYHFIGIDLSDGMLAMGRKRLIKLGLDQNIKIELGDSEELGFQDNTFDATMAAFGVRNFENLELGLRNMNRVIKKNGKIVILEFSKPKAFPFKQLFNFYFKNFLPLIGKFGSSDDQAYKYLYQSVQQFPDYERFLDKLREAGFT
ncbi:MAG: bifunctional demethylmenaquinone methyltransferase/2-methoxy-6-polyprenyl-1,4-benzoquinol methylase UbiE, partial [Saprospiraceae bacterium]